MDLSPICISAHFLQTRTQQIVVELQEPENPKAQFLTVNF